MKHILFTVLLTGSTLASAGIVSSATPDEVRAEIRLTTARTLEQLYQLHPDAKPLIAQSAGYAVFDNLSTTIVFAGGATGHGMAVDRRNSHATYMNMYGAQLGLGLGAQSYKQVFVFQTTSALNEFIRTGWQVGVQANAAAKNGKDGAAYSGAVSIAKGVWVYQMTETGLAMEATVSGVKYARDSELNASGVASAPVASMASAPARVEASAAK
ncbi:lipid-binding SYLF domain-containing protein [Jeongeupia chitinilytica]|uniref:Ysc84 actin-binding domain-containing protein n=1 Tax=Jeongeupia chitinilytica TaxID=1041641 RepID=A0ABQ3GXX3_9NEIS|nr:YSC84-related protein [Jeongeupia chitinilytica]GHD60275.1 hypothetical protein GCM10007350_13050 [Jeongeupia chitinilytica]